MGKQIFFDSEGRRQLEGGIRTLAKAVRVTFGPTGRNVILEKRFGPSSVVKDGVTVAREIEIEQPFENMGAKLLNEVATKTNKEVGDGTTTSVILAEEMISRGRKFVDSGVGPIALRTGMRKAAERAVVALQEMATPIKGRKSIEQVGRIAANNDALLGKLFADALDEVGPKGVVTVEEGTGVDSILELVDGMEIDKGYISPYFINQREEMVCRLERPMILITDRKISSIHDLVPILEKVLVTQRPLLLIAEDVEGEALAGLIINHLRGVLQAAAVKAPAFGDRRKAILEDLAVMTGGEFLSKDLG
ncbi:MAG: chaperonin GroEL, partial [Planctomycetota bacterium]